MTPPAGWRKSSYSMSNGQCAEVAADPVAVAVRDSKDTGGPVLRFTLRQWRAFLGITQTGRGR